MITWMAMVSSRDRPREGARGAQRTYRGGVEGDYRGDPATWGCWALIAPFVNKPVDCFQVTAAAANMKSPI